MFRILGKSKIAFVLAILFGISLFFFKSGSRYSNLLNSDSVIAKVSNTPISTSKFNRTFQMNIAKFNEMFGRSLEKDEIKNFQIHSLALGALINDAVFEDEFNDLNFKIDEKIIASETKKKMPQLYDKKNKLNEVYLNSFLQQQQLKIEDIVQIIDFETRDKYFNDAFFNLKFPDYFSNKINNYNNHKRKISYTEFQLENIEIDGVDTKNTTKIKLENFYEKNINNYMSEEKRNIEFFLISKKKLKKEFVTSDFEIGEYYNLNKQLFFEDEKRSFIQFNFKTNEEAKNFKKIIGNLSLNEILDYSNNKNLKFNEFQDLGSNEILEQISEPLFNLNINEISEVIETSLAKHLLILKSIKKPIQLELIDVKDKIKSTIETIEVDNYYNDITNQISKKILNGESIKNIAIFYNLELRLIENLSKSYNNYQESEKLIFKSLLNASYKANKDFVSDIIKINENLSYVFNVSDIKLPEPINFENIENEIFNDWKIEKKTKKLLLNLEKNKNNLNYITSLSKKYDLNIKEIIAKKDSTEIPINILNILFKTEENTNIQNFYNGKFYIAKVDEIIMPNENIQNKVIMNDNLRAAFGQELIKSKKININDNLINAIIDQY